MCAVRVTISRRQRQELDRRLHTAPHVGRVHDVTCMLASLAVTEGQRCEDVGLTLRVTLKPVHPWVRRWLVEGLPGLQRTKPPGRSPKLSTTPQQELAALRDEGPVQAGFASACWRSPMMQPLMIHARVGVYYNVCYLAQWLKHLGFRYQKAAFVWVSRSFPHGEKADVSWGSNGHVHLRDPPG